MQVLHIGYGCKDARAVLDGLLSGEGYLLVDVRISTASVKRPEWSYEALKKRYGRNYVWLQSLGNASRFTGGEMKLLDVTKGIPYLLGCLERGFTPILLCACKNYTLCHRQLIIEELVKRVPDIQVIEPDASVPKKEVS